MTVNDLERRNDPYCAFFSPNLTALLANYVTVVEDRHILSAKYCLPVPVFHFWPKQTHTAAWSRCDSEYTCIYSDSPFMSPQRWRWLFRKWIARLRSYLRCQ